MAKRQKMIVESQSDFVKTSSEINFKQDEEIIDSIKSAERIQHNVLPSKDYLSSIFKDHFVLYKPKSIIGGDIYWASRVENKVIVSAIDCTGHGVRGALLSMLSVAFLHEIVNENRITKPSFILNDLSNRFVKVLRQREGSSDIMDGADISLCQIDYDAHTIEYAGINNTIYLTRRNDMIEMKTEKSRFHFDNEHEFKNHSQSFDPGNKLYLFSDGYADQFGNIYGFGDSIGKKFNSRQFRQLIAEIQNQPMEEQKNILNNTIEYWKGSLEQVDDILVLGFEL